MTVSGSNELMKPYCGCGWWTFSWLAIGYKYCPRCGKPLKWRRAQSLEAK